MAQRYYIADSVSLGGVDPLVENIRRIIEEKAADWIQIREKHLRVRELLKLTVSAVTIAEGSGVRILVNTRLDVALAAGAHGLHLPSQVAPANEWRRITPIGFLIGISCHDAAELDLARSEGADFALLSPVFAPLSKKSSERPLGMEEFGRLARAASPLPVLALGGLLHQHLPDVVRAGGAGIAGISLFQR